MAQGDTLGVVMQSDIGSTASGGVAHQAVEPSLAPAFSASGTYAVGDFVTKDGVLYVCTTAHTTAAWDASHFAAANLSEYVKAANAPALSGAAPTGLYTCPPLYQYEGKNLMTAFASEIANYSDVWAWLKARLTAKNLDGIFVKDYISFTCKDNSNNDVTIKSVIAGINHDLGYNDTEITAWHIDFISEDVWPENHDWNKANYNNGIAAEPAPWCASDLKAFLNSASGNVPNAATADPATVAVNYTSTGVYDKLPAALKAVIVERRTLEPTRYSAGNLLTDDASWEWKDIGKLWIPNETEVYAQIAWGTRNGYSIGTTHQYQIFTDGKMRIKRKSGSRAAWWLRSASSGSSTYAAYVRRYGDASASNASYTSFAVPVCFRISA